MQLNFKSEEQSQKTYSVSSLVKNAKELLEENFDGIWVEAEVSDLTIAGSGHIYFTLIDVERDAQIRAVMWKGPAMRYKKLMVKGAGVCCHGRVTIYEQRGSFQFVVDSVREAGAGLKAKMLAELKKKLAQEGLFDEERKRKLPLFPSCVGVVTSRDGAALQDIIKVAKARFPTVILLAHAQVQGASAPLEIKKAMELIDKSQKADVTIVGRGGGSEDDLDAFNSEVVARAVFSHSVPVISAVGHETDFTIADLVADKRAATPSEAAQMALMDLDTVQNNLTSMKSELDSSVGHLKEKNRLMLSELKFKLKELDPCFRIQKGHESLNLLKSELANWPDQFLKEQKNLLQIKIEQIEGLNPLANLERGYAIARKTADEEILLSSNQVVPLDEIEVILSNGTIICEVKQTKNKA